VPKTGDNFSRHGYVPRLGDVVHLDWSPAIGQEMKGPHYGLVLSADLFNHSTGRAMIIPITSKVGKLSGFEMPVQAGRVSGVAVLSGLRALDYQNRDVQFEVLAGPDVAAEANRRLRMVFP
jgi:mRNA-degrading endonuclease toxin of MazEF toxin-antitoxin module